MENLEIVKIGGKILEDKGLLQKFIEDFARIDGKKILVHGGGNRSTALAASLGVESTMLNGRRITDKDNLEIVVMVYAGLLNKRLVSRLQGNGVQSLGLSGTDLNMIKATRRKHPTIDYGEVGDITKESINTEMLVKLLDQDVTPVFCAITHDGKGGLLNTNADTIAACLAAALAKHFNVNLTYCFEYKGVLKDSTNPESWIKTLNFEDYQSMVKSGSISSGMLPKLDNAFSVLKENVKTVRIKNAENFLGNEGTWLQL